MLDAPRDIVGPPGCQGTLLAHIQLAMNHNPLCLSIPFSLATSMSYTEMVLCPTGAQLYSTESPLQQPEGAEAAAALCPQSKLRWAERALLGGSHASPHTQHIGINTWQDTGECRQAHSAFTQPQTAVEVLS